MASGKQIREIISLKYLKLKTMLWLCTLLLFAGLVHASLLGRFGRTRQRLKASIFIGIAIMVTVYVFDISGGHTDGEAEERGIQNKIKVESKK